MRSNCLSEGHVRVARPRSGTDTARFVQGLYCDIPDQQKARNFFDLWPSNWRSLSDFHGRERNVPRENESVGARASVAQGVEERVSAAIFLRTRPGHSGNLQIKSKYVCYFELKNEIVVVLFGINWSQ